MSHFFHIFHILRWQDILDILILSFLFYKLFLYIKGTRAIQMIVGLTILMIASIISQLLELDAINWILQNFWTIWVIAILILFQPELRWMLAQVGRHPFFGLFYKEQRTQFDEIIRAVVSMATRRIGGLIVLERESNLTNYFEAGTFIDAKVSKELILTIFYPGSPLHDGALIIKKGRILYAGCFLPLTLNPTIDKELGTRHRAAIGLTEETDAVVIIISEETGRISLSVDGKIYLGLDSKSLRERLDKLFGFKESERASI